MVVGKIISIFDISIEVILNSDIVKIGDILTTQGDRKYTFEVVTINNVSATCISLDSTRGLQKGASVVKVSDGIEFEYSDKILGRIFNAYGVRRRAQRSASHICRKHRFLFRISA